MSRATVFVVDDDRSVRRALIRLLDSAGFHPRVFSNPLEFLKLEREGGQECLVLDIRMPQLGGLELLEQLKAAKRALPTIFITAFPSRDLAQLPGTADVVDVLYKPFDSDRLLEAIERALS